ncbi:MAG: 2-oxo-4-hydroxy-4-carboxy-5-ureidoimidazoline decarboxylase [Litorivicinaceae bacterium]|nr:2-oxo-4-hydroxy-4-carboxy-5-ureidoimidazoline decarboxylase [Litorivicinaceae bacterium]
MTPYPMALSRNAFIDRFGSIYEHAVWVAEAVFEVVEPGVSAEQLASQMQVCVDAASAEVQLALLRAHPDLAGRLALASLTRHSQDEQKGAGLDQCTPEELAEFQQLNAQYLETFGFPFIFAVRGFHRTDILAAFRQRVRHDQDTEFQTALNQVHRIARLRLEALSHA